MDITAEDKKILLDNKEFLEGLYLKIGDIYFDYRKADSFFTNEVPFYKEDKVLAQDEYYKKTLVYRILDIESNKSVLCDEIQTDESQFFKLKTPPKYKLRFKFIVYAQKTYYYTKINNEYVIDYIAYNMADATNILNHEFNFSYSLVKDDSGFIHYFDFLKKQLLKSVDMKLMNQYNQQAIAKKYILTDYMCHITDDTIKNGYLLEKLNYQQSQYDYDSRHANDYCFYGKEIYLSCDPDLSSMSYIKALINNKYNVQKEYGLSTLKKLEFLSFSGSRYEDCILCLPYLEEIK